jgi:hypothetical protein
MHKRLGLCWCVSLIDSVPAKCQYLSASASAILSRAVACRHNAGRRSVIQQYVPDKL